MMYGSTDAVVLLEGVQLRQKYGGLPLEQTYFKKGNQAPSLIAAKHYIITITRHVWIMELGE